MFPSLPDAPQLESVFRRFPGKVSPLLELHDRILSDRSPLTVGERELIAAYVSALNACTYCHGSHVLAAQAFGVDPELLRALVHDDGLGIIDPKLRTLLAFVRTLTLTPARVSDAQASAVFEAGWSEQALFDAVSVCALFSFMNRIVEGTGVRVDPLAMSADDQQARSQRMAEPGIDPFEATRSYSALLVRWRITGADRE